MFIDDQAFWNFKIVDLQKWAIIEQFNLYGV